MREYASTQRCPLKIAIAHPRFGVMGGGSIVMRDLVYALTARSDLEITVYTREWIGEVPPGLRIEIRNPFHLGSLLRDWTFEHVIQRDAVSRHDLVVSDQKIDGIDVYVAGGGVHAEWTKRKLQGLPAWRRLLGQAKPHQRFTANAEQRLFRSPTLRSVVCVSNAVRDDVLSYFPLPPERVQVVYNGIDLQKFDHRFRATNRRRLRDEMELAQKTVLLFVGGGMVNKGIFQTLHAAARSRLNFELVVVGKDRRLAEFRRAASELGIADRCRFVGAQSDVRPYYAVADIFVLPSRFETFGLVYLEAMAMGVPVLASTASGAAELIEDGVQGYRVDPSDVKDIAAKLHLLSQTAPSMEAACIALARRFPREAMAARLADVLTQAAGMR